MTLVSPFIFFSVAPNQALYMKIFSSAEQYRTLSTILKMQVLGCLHFNYAVRIIIYTSLCSGQIENSRTAGVAP